MPVRSRFSPAALLTIVAFLASFALPARADSLSDANALLKQGQSSQALDKVDQFLASKPKDAQGRFLKGLILSEMGHQQEAITVFTKLTEDYPELPEPYNNLAVIYAQQKQYEKAKQELEMAIRTHPSYATAHENLGDIYARLASQAYDKALQLDSSNTRAQTKLAMIRELMSTSARPGAERPASPATASAAPAVAPSRNVDPKPAAKTGPKPVAKAEPKQVAAITPNQPAPVAVPVRAQEPGIDPTPELAKAIDDWAAAWSHKDTKRYFASYSPDFSVPGGQARTAWEAQRTQRINKPGAIEVGYENLRVSREGPDRVIARIRQHYRSASLKTSSNKVLVFVRRDGKWLIQQERVGN
jgi:tetratricopeptide (TPR) repeat protein